MNKKFSVLLLVMLSAYLNHAVAADLRSNNATLLNKGDSSSKDAPSPNVDTNKLSTKALTNSGVASLNSDGGKSGSNGNNDNGGKGGGNSNALKGPTRGIASLNSDGGGNSGNNNNGGKGGGNNNALNGATRGIASLNSDGGGNSGSHGNNNNGVKAPGNDGQMDGNQVGNFGGKGKGPGDAKLNAGKAGAAKQGALSKSVDTEKNLGLVR